MSQSEKVKKAHPNLRDLILASDDITREMLVVPEWQGIEVEVVSLSGKERAALLQDAANNNGKIDLGKLYPDLVILSCVYPGTSDKIFQPADRGAVAGKNGAALERVAQVAMRLSGLSEDVAAEAEGN